MKNNRLLILAGVALTFFTSQAYSLGLGGISSDSTLNEPLIAEIELINVGDLENSEILVGIGTESDYNLAGVTKEFFHSSLEFEVMVEETTEPRIIVRSRQPLTEPYLNFIVQIRWPQGKLLREYTILLDLPLFSDQSAPKSVAPPSATPATTAKEAVAQQARQQERQQQQPARRNESAPTGSVSSNRVNIGSRISSGEVYKVGKGETLWAIADRVSQSNGTSLHQAMIALHEENLDAFVNGDINRLRANAELRVPSGTQMNAITEGQAGRDFAALIGSPSAAPIQSAQTNFRDDLDREAPEPNGRLSLSTSGEADSDGESSDGNPSSISEQVNATLSENAALKEELDAAAIENQELEARVANLQEQIELLEAERELALESEALAAVQEAVEETPEPEIKAPPVQQAEPETIWDKINAFKYWIIGGFALLIVVALMIAFMVIRGRKSNDVDDLYYDEDDIDQIEESSSSAMAADATESEDADSGAQEADGVSDFLDDLDDNETDDIDLGEDGELDDARMTGDALDGDGLDDLADLHELSEFDESIDESIDELAQDAVGLDNDIEGSESSADEDGALSFAGAGADGNETQQFDADEFEDLDEFFSTGSSDTAEILFGEESEVGEQDAPTQSSTPENDIAGESGSLEEDSMLEFSAPGEADYQVDDQLDDIGSATSDHMPSADANDQLSSEDEGGLDFDLSEVDLSLDSDEALETETESEKDDLPTLLDEDDLDQSDEDGDIDLEDDFGFSEIGLTDDLTADAEAEFEKSIEVHSTDMEELLVPETALEGLEDAAENDANEGLEERSEEGGTRLQELAEDTESSTEDAEQHISLDAAEEPVSAFPSDLDMDEDLDLDADMEADLDDLDLGDDALEASDDEEFITKLELAEAYIEMGDVQGAEELLKEVEEGGNEEQKATAKAFIDQIKERS